MEQEVLDFGIFESDPQAEMGFLGFIISDVERLGYELVDNPYNSEGAKGKLIKYLTCKIDENHGFSTQIQNCINKAAALALQGSFDFYHYIELLREIYPSSMQLQNDGEF